MSNNAIYKDNKIILITNRLIENPLYKPAEEILLHHVVEKLGMTYEKIEYEGHEVNNFFGKLPVVYYNGRIITHKNLILFIKSLIFGPVINTEYDQMIDNALFIIKDGLSLANEYYYYIKLKEKIEKSKNKKMFSSIKSYLFQRSDYESISNYLINTFPGISNLSNVYLPAENKLYDLIKDSFTKINFITKEEFNDRNQNLFFKLIIYSFLKEDKVLFSKVKRPLIENLKYDEDKMFASIGAYYKGVEDGVIKNTDVKFINANVLNNNQELLELYKKLSISFNPKSTFNSKKIEDIQEYQVRTNLYHQIFSIGIFCSFAGIIYYFTMRKNK